MLFSDDTNLFSSGLDATGIQGGVSHDLAIITEWLTANKLSLNIKRHIACVLLLLLLLLLLLFFLKIKTSKIKPDISLKIDGEIIAEVISSKFLGVIIDDE